MISLDSCVAQINIARARGGLEEPVMQGFVSRLAEINAIAERSPGFVWRLTGDGVESAYLQPYEDPRIIVNMSVWETIESLKTFVYRTAHVGPLRNRAEWFLPVEGPHVALWWVPRDRMPTLEEGKQRLEVLKEHGPTPMAFNFQLAFPALPFQAEQLSQASAGVNYDGRTLRLHANSSAGDCGSDTTFRYRQLGSVIWATYEGSGVRAGTLCGAAENDGAFSAMYQHRNNNGDLRRGFCRSTPEPIPGGALCLRENWHWLDGSGKGETLLSEKVA